MRNRLNPQVALLAAILALGACAESRPPEETPTEDGGPYDKIDPVPDPLAAALDRVEPVEGGWMPEEGGPGLVFARADGTSLVGLRCDERGGLLIDRINVEPGGYGALVGVRVGGEMSRLAGNRIEGEPATVRAAVTPGDSLMEKLAAPEGSVRIAAGNAPAVELPLGPATREKVLACRAGEGTPGGGGAEQQESRP